MLQKVSPSGDVLFWVQYHGSSVAGYPISLMPARKIWDAVVPAAAAAAAAATTTDCCHLSACRPKLDGRR